MTFILLAFVLSTKSWAQTPGGTQDGNSQLSLFYGKVLPNGLQGDDEIFSLWGFRYSHSLSSDNLGYAEFDVTNNAGGSMDWLGGSAGLRMDIPVETLVGLALIGVNYTTYTAEGASRDSAFGVYAGGGIMSHIGGNAHFRFNMKINSKPGTFLLFDLGFVFDL